MPGSCDHLGVSLWRCIVRPICARSALARDLLSCVPAATCSQATWKRRRPSGGAKKPQRIQWIMGQVPSAGARFRGTKPGPLIPPGRKASVREHTGNRDPSLFARGNTGAQWPRRDTSRNERQKSPLDKGGPGSLMSQRREWCPSANDASGMCCAPGRLTPSVHQLRASRASDVDKDHRSRRTAGAW